MAAKKRKEGRGNREKRGFDRAEEKQCAETPLGRVWQGGAFRILKSYIHTRMQSSAKVGGDEC